MRFNEILLEYNRAITAKQTNAENLLKALISDRSIQLPPELGSIKSLLEVSYLRILKSPELSKFVESILAAIEDRDPTPNNEYTPWLVRMYSKGGIKYEDLNRMNLLGLFHLGKKKKIIQPEHRDINRFKTYNEFENVIIDNYPPDAFEEEEGEKPQARKVFENDEVVIIIPENEAAACKYGRQTRWCTAAVNSYNYFEQYNRQGNLYILIPKNPKHDGEKYQLHFESDSFMDEDDYGVSLLDLLDNRFGSEVLEFFKKERPEIQNTILFMPKETLEPVMQKIKERAEEHFWDITSEWEVQDDGYYEYLRDKGYTDEDGSIDWDLVPEEDTYWNYNDDVRWLHRDLTDALDITDLKEYFFENMENYDLSDLSIKYMASLFGSMLVDDSKKIARSDGSWVIEQIGEKLKKLYVLPDGNNGWVLK